MTASASPQSATKWLVSAIGQDQPGIVAALTKAIFDLDCNLEDTSMTQLEDHFAVLIILEAPEQTSQEVLMKRLVEVREAFNLQLSLFPIQTQSQQVVSSGEPWSISVSGADHLGIVYMVTQFLAHRQINISHLSTKRLTKPSGQSLFLMALEVEIPASLPITDVQADLNALAQEQALEIHAEPLEVYTL